MSCAGVERVVHAGLRKVLSMEHSQAPDWASALGYHGVSEAVACTMLTFDTQDEAWG